MATERALWWFQITHRGQGEAASTIVWGFVIQFNPWGKTQVSENSFQLFNFQTFCFQIHFQECFLQLSGRSGARKSSWPELGPECMDSNVIVSHSQFPHLWNGWGVRYHPHWVSGKMESDNERKIVGIAPSTEQAFDHSYLCCYFLWHFLEWCGSWKDHGYVGKHIRMAWLVRGQGCRKGGGQPAESLSDIRRSISTLEFGVSLKRS